MAKRPVFRSIGEPPYYLSIETAFTFYSGFSLAQKQRCIASLHTAYHEAYPHDRILEVSTRSPELLGVSLSAFKLLSGTSLGYFPVECVFQSSKVFQGGGPYTDLLFVDPSRAKRDERIRSSGPLIGFECEGVAYPTEPKDLFYSWIYATALAQHPDLLRQTCEYDAFTDIEFNPARSINCQAKVVAVAVGLERAGCLSAALESVDAFVRLVYDSVAGPSAPGQMTLFDISTLPDVT